MHVIIWTDKQRPANEPKHKLSVMRNSQTSKGWGISRWPKGPKLLTVKEETKSWWMAFILGWGCWISKEHKEKVPKNVSLIWMIFRTLILTTLVSNVSNWNPTTCSNLYGTLQALKVMSFQWWIVLWNAMISIYNGSIRIWVGQSKAQAIVERPNVHILWARSQSPWDLLATCLI